eukprot:gene10000-10154_t
MAPGDVALHIANDRVLATPPPMAADLSLSPAGAAVDKSGTPTAQASSSTADEPPDPLRLLPVVPDDQTPSSPFAEDCGQVYTDSDVVQDSYEYHGLNKLFRAAVVALAVTLVLYWHWGRTTAIFKATVQNSFQSFGNPDWQTQSLVKVDTMNDAVEYSMGWLEFWLQRANALGMECYRDDPLTQELRTGKFGGINNRTINGTSVKVFDNIFEYSGWQRVGPFSNSETIKSEHSWWAYTIVAPKYNGTDKKLHDSSRDMFVSRLYNITRNTCLNINNCDWLNATCPDASQTNFSNPCSQGMGVPMQEWWQDADTCSVAQPNSSQVPPPTFVKRGNLSFPRYPESELTGQPGAVLDLKPFLAKYAYGISLDVLAVNPMIKWSRNLQSRDTDRALFSMLFQRSVTSGEDPTRVMWQITSTVPARTGFYVYHTDYIRILFEFLLLICIVYLVWSQVWQFRVCRVQFRSWSQFLTHYWNDYEIVSTVLLLAWVVVYVMLIFQVMVASGKWDFNSWSFEPGNQDTHDQYDMLSYWARSYARWLYMGIVVDFVICLRMARYMRIHVGLKAFYQVFIIAAREFLDFAVFLLYILVLLGSTVFAFFQLTGGNYQFLRFADGLSVMSRLTFGFLTYDEFQSQALGVGAAVSAVTFLFWVAVLLLVVYTQNIVLAIVAEAYEEAKAKLGTAETSFFMLVLMRLLFFFLYVVYRIRMFFGDVFRFLRGRQQLSPEHGGGRAGSASRARSGSADGSPGDDGAGEGPFAGNRHDSGGLGVGSWHGASIQGGSLTTEESAPCGNGIPSGLQPTTSVTVVLPEDVYRGLSTHKAHGRRPRRKARRLHASLSIDQRLPTGPRHDLQTPDQVAASGQSTLRSRLKPLWDGMTSSRHANRMYKDLLNTPKGEAGWIAAWKCRYWAPWCVARTDPVKAVMHLYMDFSSYKLKEKCTWSEAEALFHKIYEEARRGHPGGHAQSGDAAAPGSPFAVSPSGFASLGPELLPDEQDELPVLTFDCFVDEDTLSRLFLLTKKMYSNPSTSDSSTPAAASETAGLQMWWGPFKSLDMDSVRHLVQGVSQVYGVSEDEMRARLANTTSGSVLDEPLGSIINGCPTGSSERKDAMLGRSQGRGGGGFFSNLNLKRREGANNQSKQLEQLLHVQQRMEEVVRGTEQKVNAYRASVTQQANSHDLAIRDLRGFNSEVLKQDGGDLSVASPRAAGAVRGAAASGTDEREGTEGLASNADMLAALQQQVEQQQHLIRLLAARLDQAGAGQ